MVSKSSRRWQTLFFGFAVIVSCCMAANMLTLSWETITLPASDYFGVFARYLAFSEGEMSFLSFVLSKHGDHNHAFAYFLSLIDIYVDNGKLRLLHWVQLASHITVYGLMLYAAFKLVRPIGIRGLLLLFISSQVFAIQGTETWAFPFQVVLASFRLFFIAGLLWFCLEVTNAHAPRNIVLVVSLLLLLVAALSHGSGVVIFALLFVLAGIWGGRKVVFMLLPFFLIFVSHEIFHTTTPLTELLFRIPINELFKTPYYLAFLLGNCFAWGAPAGVQVAVGVTGILLWVVLCAYFLKNRNHEPGPALFFIAVSTFSLLGGVLSVLLNLSYMEYRHVSVPPSLEYFLSSRYLITTSGFWIGLAVAGLARLTSGKTQMLLSICLCFSSAAAVWQGITEKPGWQHFIAQQKMSEVLLSTDTWKELPQEVVRERLLLSSRTSLDSVLDAQKRLGLGVYASSLAGLIRQRAIERTADISDVNWLHGVANSGAGFVVINITENKSRLTPGRKIRFADGEVSTITSQSESGIYLNIALDGEPMDGNRVGYPNKFEIIE